MVVKLLLVGMVMVRLVNLGLCFNNRDNDLIVYTPKPAVLNKDFLMICETTKDINGIRWRKNGQNIAFVYSDACFVADDSKNYSYSCKEGQFNLTIPKTKLTDELHGSVWSCVNPYGGVSNKLNLYVNNGPKSIRHSLPSTNLIIPEHESSDAVTCSSDCNPACNFTWWYGDTRVSDGNTLILTNVSKDQAGTYVCNASNVIGSGMTEIKIDVLYPPKITELEAKTNPVMENDTLDLLCKADSFPTSNVSWMKSNTTLSYAAMADYHHIKYAKCLDTGTYICKASNGHGEPVSKAIDIFVNCKPRLDHRIMTQQNIQTKYLKTGSYLMIKFHFIAYPAPKVSWGFYRNGFGSESPVLLSKHNVDVSEQNNLFMHTYRLIILSIKDEDFGYYTIDVENQYGQSTAQVHVVKKTTFLKVYIIIGLSSGLGLCILAFVVVCCVCRRKSKRKEDIFVQIQELEMQHCHSVYQNNGRVMELLAAEFYDDLTEDDPIYNESKYGKMKEIKEKDETEKCSPFERIQEFEMQHCESVYQNNGRVMDDSAGEKRQSASSDEYDDIYAGKSSNTEEIKQASE